MVVVVRVEPGVFEGPGLVTAMEENDCVRVLKIWPLYLPCGWSTDVLQAKTLRLQLTRFSGYEGSRSAARLDVRLRSGASNLCALIFFDQSDLRRIDSLRSM